MNFRIGLFGLAMVAVLAACDNGPSAVETRDRTGEPAPAAADPPAIGAIPVSGPAAAPAITATRTETSDAKAQRLFDRNGAAFGATSVQDYLDRANAFIRSPPAGTETVRRPNGDTLFYQASTNTFAVASGDSVLKTMFKPDDGPAYWAEQRDRAPNFGQRREDRG